MSIGAATIMTKLRSHAAALGVFDHVVGHEPLSAPPGSGTTVAFWTTDLTPLPQRSGLASTSLLWAVTASIYNPAQTEPQDDLDPNVVEASVALMTAYSGDFDLGGLISYVDLLGASGQRLGGSAGYLQMQDTVYRSVLLTVPMVLDDVIAQVK